jgi:hypothetical protein
MGQTCSAAPMQISCYLGQTIMPMHPLHPLRHLIGWKPLVVGMLVCSFWGCCKDSYQDNNWVTNVLRSNPLSTFIDSSGNYFQLVLVDSAYHVAPDMEYPTCDYYTPNTRFMYYPLAPGEIVEYSQRGSAMRIKDINMDFSLYISDVSYGGVRFRALDTSIVVQGESYPNTWYVEETDTFGIRQIVAIDKTHGLVLFQHRDEYRWERVLNP